MLRHEKRAAKMGTVAVTLCLVATIVSTLGCVEEPVTSTNQEPFIFIPDGKADDYRSTKGREYALSAVDSVQLPVDDADLHGDARQARVQELVELRFKALSFFAYAYLASKTSHDSNASYGGFRTTIRQQTFESLLIEERADEPGTFDFIFEAEAGGPSDLLRSIPMSASNAFDLIVPKLTTSEIESGSYSSKYRNFDPATLDASTLETIQVHIESKPSEPDAYPEYARLFEDGLLDVAVHVGGDYNEQRYDLTTARDIFDALQSDVGLEAPVASFEELRSDSGPFVGELDANGRTIKLNVYLYHPDMQKEEGLGYNGLLALYRLSASTRDIVMYDGHAGYDTNYSGIVVHYNPRYAIAADDFASLDLPEKYQIFFFNGCKTYTAYADAMYQHPRKTTDNLDIITTVNFSWLTEMSRVTSDFLGHITEKADATHLPQSYDDILSALNRDRSWDVIYGVHGLSDNPRRSPYAVVESLCAACGKNDDCPGVDNLCVTGLNGRSQCAVACTDPTGCPAGYACSAAAARGSDLISTSQCVPAGGECL